MTSITFDHLTKRYDEQSTAVDDFSAHVAASEFLVLVGPSGCGKSSLLRMVAGLESISEGELRFDAQRMNEVEARHRDIGMVFQNYALYPHLTVFENIAFALRVRKEEKSRIERRVHEVASMLSIDGVLTRLPKQLSGGQRQRVALGRAIARQPRLFLFDEPLSNLDANLRVEMRAELTTLQRQLGTTSMYVTHDHAEAMTMGHRIAVMNHGRLMQIGTPHDVYRNPDNLFVCSFLSSPMLNVYHGSLVQDYGLAFLEKSGRFRVALDEAQIRRTPKQLPQSVQLAVRAEDLRLCHNNAEATCSAQVDFVEYVGHERIVHLRSESLSFRARSTVDENPLIGSTGFVQFQKTGCFVFAEDGLRL